jgi:ABC-type phosphate transport system substrate-binding protein
VKKIIVVMMAFLILAAACGLAAGCGSSNSQAKQTLSTDIQGLKTELSALLDPNTYKSIDSFQAQWSKIQTSYNKLVTDAKQVKDVQVAGVKSAFEDLKKSIGDISSDASLQSKITGILVAGQEFLASIEELNTAVTPSQ